MADSKTYYIVVQHTPKRQDHGICRHYFLSRIDTESLADWSVSMSQARPLTVYVASAQYDAMLRDPHTTVLGRVVPYHTHARIMIIENTSDEDFNTMPVMRETNLYYS